MSSTYFLSKTGVNTSFFFTSQCIEAIPRLKSPIQLEQRILRSPSVRLLPFSFFSPLLTRHTTYQAPKFRASSNRRDSPTSHGSIASQRRRRHCQRDCHFETIGASNFFDQLPWISAMENSNQSNKHDIADLSQLDILPPSSRSISGPGPVRRRRTSPRSSPLAVTPARDLTATSLLSLCSQRFDPLSPPKTPLSHLSHTRVHFNNLLPVFSPIDPNNGESNRCKI
jgi:hypothetical protein